MAHPPTQTEIRTMLDEAALRPQKRYGQHFLIDGNLMRMLVEAAELGPRDTVLEVGPGVGNLTELLVERAGWVVAVEVDPAIAEVARGRLAGATNLDLLVTDVLADKHTLSPAVLDAVAQRRAALGGPMKLVANLPYAAATPLVAELLWRDEPPERLVFTVQEEVALRLTAEPSTPDYGPVGVFVQAVAEVDLVRRLAPSVFWPRPRVWSSMVCVRPSAERRGRIADLAVFRRTIEGLFGHRRKRAAKSLALSEKAWAAKGDLPFSAGSAEAWAARLSEAGLDPEARGEAYTVEEIIRLANWIAQHA